MNDKDRRILRSWQRRTGQVAQLRKQTDLLRAVTIRKNVRLGFRRAAEETRELNEIQAKKILEGLREET